MGNIQLRRNAPSFMIIIFSPIEFTAAPVSRTHASKIPPVKRVAKHDKLLLLRTQLTDKLWVVRASNFIIDYLQLFFPYLRVIQQNRERITSQRRFDLRYSILYHYATR